MGGSSKTGGDTSAATGGGSAGSKTGGTAGGANGGAAGAGGKSASGGSAVGGKSSGGGSSASGGTTSTGIGPGLSCNSQVPTHTGSQTATETISITGVKDYAFQRICADPDKLGKGDQSENQKPLFKLAKGATLRNVIIGGAGCSAADGVHCESGSCTLENVWIADVGEDAITFKGSDTSQVMTITGGGAFEASDKVVQHNGPGTIKIDGFFVKNAGKLYRSCGNCSNNGFARHVEMTNIFASGVKVLAGINANYGDTAKLTNITRCGTVNTMCQTFTGNSSGDEPTSLTSYGASGGDGNSCIFSSSDIK